MRFNYGSQVLVVSLLCFITERMELWHCGVYSIEMTGIARCLLYDYCFGFEMVEVNWVGSSHYTESLTSR